MCLSFVGYCHVLCSECMLDIRIIYESSAGCKRDFFFLNFLFCTKNRLPKFGCCFCFADGHSITPQPPASDVPCFFVLLNYIVNDGEGMETEQENWKGTVTENRIL